ncbi:MAG: hypothetical protein WEG56_07760 [Chloroflexota bacterium]
MTESPGNDRPNPRIILGFLAAILAAQAFYAGTSIFREPLDSGDPLRLLVAAAFLVYAAMVVTFAVGVWRRMPWAWALAVAIAAAGLVIAGLQIAGGVRWEDLILGMLVDGALLYYLNKPSIKGLFST